MPLLFDKRLFIFLSIGFILATIVGTLSHECGHYIAALCLGFRGSRIGYAYTVYGEMVGSAHALHLRALIATAAGPLETVLVGTIAFTAIQLHKTKYLQATALSWQQWVVVFLSLFWLREPCNLVVGTAIKMFRGITPRSGDEAILSSALGLGAWSLAIVLGIIGAIICYMVLFKFVPPRQRLTLLAAGVTGGITGAVLWFIVLGPHIMPR